MKIPTTHEVMDLMMAVEGYRAQAQMFERELDAANARLAQERETSKALYTKVKELQQQLADAQRDLKVLDAEAENYFQTALNGGF